MTELTRVGLNLRWNFGNIYLQVIKESIKQGVKGVEEHCGPTFTYVIGPDLTRLLSNTNESELI